MTSTRTIKTLFVTLLLCLLPFSASLADDDDYPMMGPGGCPMMGSGQMGMGGMGMGMMGMMGNMGGMPMMDMGMGMPNHFYLLDLSDTQRKALRDIERKTRAEHFTLQEKITDLNDQLYALYKQDKPDAKKVGEVYQQLFNLKRQMIELHINARNQQYDLLTKEQQAKLKELTSGMPYGRGPGGMMPHMMR